MAKQIGTSFIETLTGEVEVPRYAISAGESLVSAAKALGLRPLARREKGEVVAVIEYEGQEVGCVEVTK